MCESSFYPRKQTQLNPLRALEGGANVMTRNMKLLQNQSSQIQAAENVRKVRKQSNKVLRNEGILYARDARSITLDRQKLKEERQRDREKAWEKRYLNALKGCYRATKLKRASRIKQAEGLRQKWRVILKELVHNRGVGLFGCCMAASVAWLQSRNRAKVGGTDKVQDKAQGHTVEMAMPSPHFGLCKQL